MRGRCVFTAKILALRLLSIRSDAVSTTDISVTTASVFVSPPPPPPIVYTIAGSDSGGGAGIQADLRTMHSMGCHGCTAITCLTAQNSMGVSAIHAPPADFLREQLDSLLSDLPPRAVKVGMLGTASLAIEVGRFLALLKKNYENDCVTSTSASPPLIVVDPVMVSTSGAKLIDDEAQQAMVEHVFPYADVLTPNKHEAEALLGRKLLTPKDVEDGAVDILKMGVKSVIIKGGHSLTEDIKGSDQTRSCPPVLEYAQDFFLSSEDEAGPGEGRLCDGAAGLWLRSKRFDTIHTHGTGCSLSSAIASALAIGHQQREFSLAGGGHVSTTGAGVSMGIVDACVLGKAYVTAGIDKGVQLGEGPGPVAHTKFPSSHKYFPTLLPQSSSNSTVENTPSFVRMQRSSSINIGTDTTSRLGAIMPIVNTVELIEQLSQIDEITDVQLRIKDATLNTSQIFEMVQKAQNACATTGVRLWINDYWEAAVAARCFGVHVGQEDLKTCVDNGGLSELSDANIALGISTHSYAELAVALGIRPSYISLGPIFGTVSKNVAFGPQGLETVTKWRQLIPPDIPLIAIGGIGDGATAKRVKEAGADGVAVIGAVTRVKDIVAAVGELVEYMKY